MLQGFIKGLLQDTWKTWAFKEMVEAGKIDVTGRCNTPGALAEGKGGG